MSDRWISGSYGQRLWVRHFGEDAPEQDARRLAPPEALSALARTWAQGGAARASLAEFGQPMGSRTGLVTFDVNRRTRELDAAWRVIESRIRSESLVVWESAEPRGMARSPAAPPPPPPRPPVSPPRPERTFIEIRLEDEGSGAPIPDEPVLVVDPNGVRYERRTGDDGLVRIEGLDPGVCDVSFPRIDGRDWRPR